MRRQRQQRRTRTGQATIAIQEGQRSGNLVLEAKEVSFAHGGQRIVRGFSTTVMRGDKIGIIGPNGAGKTTLLRLLLGELEPQQGSVRLGTNLQVAYFDQLRRQLDEEETVQHNVGEGYDSVKLGGKSRHILSYLQDFLFAPERSRTPVKFLSGGERNRVLLAKLFARPANVLVLDEPTNDLDTETLELLEARLVQFDGTVLLVSHDREFLNNVVTSTIVFEDGDVKEYAGGYDDWLRQRPRPAASDAKKARSREAEKAERSPKAQAAAGGRRQDQPRRLSYNEQRELSLLPGRIEELEGELATVEESMGDPEFYRQPGEVIAQETSRVKDLQSQLAAAYQRWEELESIE